ncbi:MAG: translation initiation factor IF-2 subunit gamma [Desulfurococcales archaeon]|nr:translation initiation factor IF-2 subunit gamma [Desulfurococcales archaeon]MEB3789725.1 translation initiation factor IF-2 subunit gamma [Desulfurococcales archaeon]
MTTGEKRQPEVNIGVVGHVDHGKTTLVQALTGVWTMRHSEEIRRGMTIKLGYADGEVWECEGCGFPERFSPEPVCECNPDASPILRRRISYVDAPGHEILMATMLSGAALMDGAILVIAANEPCPQPQTREHLVALEIIGVDKIIIVQNKVDVVSPERARESFKEIKEFVKGTIAENAPIIPVSALKRANIDAVLAAIEELVPTPERDLESPPLMFIARSFDVNRPGTPPERLVGGVIGGGIIHGVFRVGQEIEIRPGLMTRKPGGRIEYEPIYTEISSLRFGNIEVEEAKPGGLVAIGTKLDPALTKSDNLVGNAVGLPGKLPPTLDQLRVEFKLLERVVGLKEAVKVEPIRKGEMLMLTVGTSITLGITTNVGSDYFEAKLRRPIVAWDGARIAISRRVHGRWRLVGWGHVRL